MAAVRGLQRVAPQALVGRHLPASMMLVMAIILLALAALGVGAAAYANPISVTDGPVGPLYVYAAIMPGQSLSALEFFACGTAYPNDSSAAAFYCTVRPNDDLIRSISVYGSNGKVDSLTIRASGLRVGDLIAYWGHPDLTRVFKRSFTLAWDEGIYVVGSLRGRFNYWSPATYVLVMLPED